MTDQIEQRLAELRQEHAKGQELLVQTEAEAADLRAQLLRISGAIQVLEELLDGDGTVPPELP
jgi:uncharacterized protein (DUF3084 family)